MNKVCLGCNKNLELNEVNFYKKGGNNKNNGYQSRCKICFNLRNKENKLKNKDKISQYLKQYYLDNIESFKKNSKNYYINNKEKFSEYGINRYKNNSKYFLDYNKKYKEKLKTDPIKLQNFIIARRKSQKIWKDKNKHIIILRNQIKNIIEILNTEKINSMSDELKYSPLEFKKYIESQFLENMSWDNLGIGVGKWNVDHKIPISWFIDKTPFYLVNNLSNLQPLWWELNNLKSNKYSDKINYEYYNLIKNYIKQKYINEILVLL